jgi:hypothetical protein
MRSSHSFTLRLFLLSVGVRRHFQTTDSTELPKSVTWISHLNSVKPTSPLRVGVLIALCEYVPTLYDVCNRSPIPALMERMLSPFTTKHLTCILLELYEHQLGILRNLSRFISSATMTPSPSCNGKGDAVLVYGATQSQSFDPPLIIYTCSRCHTIASRHARVIGVTDASFNYRHRGRLHLIRHRSANDNGLRTYLYSLRHSKYPSRSVSNCRHAMSACIN